MAPLTKVRRNGGDLRDFVILGRSDAKRSEDPGIHAVIFAVERSGAEFCTVGTAPM